MFLIPECILGNVQGAREEKNAGSVLAAVVTVLLGLSALAQQSFMLMLTVLQVSGHLVGRLAPGSRLQVSYRFMPQVQAMCSAPWSPRHKTVSQTGPADVQPLLISPLLMPIGQSKSRGQPPNQEVAS